MHFVYEIGWQLTISIKTQELASSGGETYSEESYSNYQDTFECRKIPMEGQKSLGL